MGDLLTITDFNSDDFIARLAGAYDHSLYLSNRAALIQKQTDRRIEAMRRNTFKILYEIGEMLLRVQEQVEQSFIEWFEEREFRLNFSYRTALRCKSIAKLVRENNKDVDAAYRIALAKHEQHAEPILAMAFRLLKPPDEMTHKERCHWRDRFRPVVELDQRLAALESS